MLTKNKAVKYLVKAILDLTKDDKHVDITIKSDKKNELKKEDKSENEQI